MSSVKKPAAPVQHTYRLTEVDKFQIQVLQADEKAEKDPVKKNNILACINYIKGHGIPKEDSHVLYAHNSKAVQELKMEYRKKIGSNGPLHAYATDSELMTGAGAGDGDDAGSGSGSMKSVEEYKAKPPTAKELRELLYLQVRIPDKDGGSEKDAQALKIWNDTGCSTQVILYEDFQRLLGFRPALPAQNGKPAQAAQPAREYKGQMGTATTHTASGLASRRKIDAMIRLCTVPDCSIRLREEWQDVEVNIAWDTNALRLSGNAMRKYIGFATPPGNQFLVASPSRRALAWQVLRFPAAKKG